MERSMAHSEAYLQWSQSERVDVLVGTEEDGDKLSRLFRMPIDLLGRRSRTFQAMLDGCFLESTTGLIKLPETSIATFQDFYIWALSRSPHIDSEISFEAVADLAILATMYDVISLQNQAVDVIRNKLSRDEWQLQPAVVQRIYQNVGEESALRRLIRVSLGTIKGLNNVSHGQKAPPRATEEVIQEWRKVFAEIADVGADYFETTNRGWGRNELNLGGPCRFHDHRRRPVPNNGMETATECPFGIVECFVNEFDAVRSKKQKKNQRVKVKLPEEDFGDLSSPGEPVESE